MMLPSDYPLAVAAALGMSWQCWGFGAQVSRFRNQHFNEDFMRKQWGATHKTQIGEDIQKGGFPDTGNGLYSQRLSYRQWYSFNVLQRIHLNCVEGISLGQTSVLAAGLYRPREAALAGLVYILGRILYSYGAKTKKAFVSKIRIAGVALSLVSTIVNSGIFLYYLVQHLKK